MNNQGVSIKQIMREKEMADSISEKCDIVLQQHDSIRGLEGEAEALKQEIEKLKTAGVKEEKKEV